MLDIIYRYQNLLENLGTLIDQSPFKKEYLINELQLSRATFYNKLKKRSFTIAEMLKLSTILFPEEAKSFEIKQALERSRADSNDGRTREHADVIKDARNRIFQ